MKHGFSTTSIIREWDGIKIGLQTRYGTFGDLVACSRCARFCYATSEFNLIAKTAARLTVFRIATGNHSLLTGTVNKSPRLRTCTEATRYIDDFVCGEPCVSASVLFHYLPSQMSD